MKRADSSAQNFITGSMEYRVGMLVFYLSLFVTQVFAIVTERDVKPSGIAGVSGSLANSTLINGTFTFSHRATSTYSYTSIIGVGSTTSTTAASTFTSLRLPKTTKPEIASTATQSLSSTTIGKLSIWTTKPLKVTAAPTSAAQISQLVKYPNSTVSTNSTTASASVSLSSVHNHTVTLPNSTSTSVSQSEQGYPLQVSGKPTSLIWENGTSQYKYQNVSQSRPRPKIAALAAPVVKAGFAHFMVSPYKKSENHKKEELTGTGRKYHALYYNRVARGHTFSTSCAY